MTEDASTGLSGLRVLLVEDEYFLADELRGYLANLGAVVIGPVGTVEEALDLIEADTLMDVALLDVNLQGHTVFVVAERLEDRTIPFLFTTGYDASIIPGRFAGIGRLEKPVNAAKLRQALLSRIRTPPRSSASIR